MFSRVRKRLRAHDGNTTTQNNIGDGIPKAPGRNWIHEVKRKITRSGNAHDPLSNNITPPSGMNGSIRTAAPVSIPQQLEVRDPATTSIDHITASQPPIVEVGEAGEAAPTQDGLNASIAQAAFQPSLAETLSLNVKKTAAPNTEDTSGASLKKKSQIPVPSSEVRRSSWEDIASLIAQIWGDNEESTAVDNRAPIIAQSSAAEQEGKNLGHGPKQKQNVLAEPASREYSQSQREQFAKRNVDQALEHLLRECERVRIAICIDMEDYEGSRRVCVTCFDGAVDKANEIEKILAKNGKSLHGFSFVVHRRRGTRIFGYRGSDVDRINATAITSESSGDDHLVRVSGSGNRIHYGNNYNTYTNYNGNRSDGGDQDFSNTPYWTRGSTMVEIFCGDEGNGNVTGAPIRMATTRMDGSSAVALWTCGGIISVGGIDYGLTTAHPLVLSNSFRPRNSPQEKPASEDADKEKDLLVDNGPFGGRDDFFSAEEHPEKYWQAIGKVSHYALAKMGSIPSNNDWLLFELPKDRFMWNEFGSNTKSNELGKDAESEFHALAVFTARGTLAAHILEGTAFLILGNSPFEVLKIGLQEPLRPGDSGSWLMRDSELIGVMIAGSEEDSEKPIGYAISAQEVYRSISTSMGGLVVRPLTVLENAINANNQTGGSQRDLAVLRVRQLFDVDAPVRRTKILPDHHALSSLANIQTGDAALTALLKLGFFCAPIGLDVPTTRRSQFTVMPSWNKTKRIGEMLLLKMSQLSEGVVVTRLILALSASLPLSEIQARQRECARALAVLMEELNISPLPAQSQLRALVGSVCNRHTLPKPIDVHYGGPKETTSPTSLAGSLGRALYAIRTNSFFVIEGVTARYLRKFLLAYTRYPVIAVNDDIADRLTNSLRTFGIVPRIFVARLDTRERPRVTRSNDPFWGEVVEFDELNDVLESSTAYRKAQRRVATRGEDRSRVTT